MTGSRTLSASPSTRSRHGARVSRRTRWMAAPVSTAASRPRTATAGCPDVRPAGSLRAERERLPGCPLSTVDSALVELRCARARGCGRLRCRRRRAIRRSVISQPRATAGATSAITSSATAAIVYVVGRLSRMGCAVRRACAARRVSPTNQTPISVTMPRMIHTHARSAMDLREDAPRRARPASRCRLWRARRRGSRPRSGARRARGAPRRARRSRVPGSRSCGAREPARSREPRRRARPATSSLRPRARTFVIVCAASSWLSSMIAILPADSGNLSATRPITATWSPSSITIGRRSSTTAPPSVWMNVVSSSSNLTSWRWVAVVVSTHTVCTRGRSRAASAARSALERARPASTGASPCCCAGRRSAIAASTSTLANSWSTAVFATCVRIASFSIMFREIVSNPSSSRAVCST